MLKSSKLSLSISLSSGLFCVGFAVYGQQMLRNQKPKLLASALIKAKRLCI